MYSFVIFCVSLKVIVISFTVPFFLWKSAYINFSTVVHILSHKIRIVYDITVPFSDLISLNISSQMWNVRYQKYAIIKNSLKLLMSSVKVLRPLQENFLFLLTSKIHAGGWFIIHCSLQNF